MVNDEPADGGRTEAGNGQSIGAIARLNVCRPPGGRTIRSVPELNASGGQVIGSTARARRFMVGLFASGMHSCSHGQDRSQVIATPRPFGPTRRRDAPPAS